MACSNNDILRELNVARSNPLIYEKYLEELLTRYEVADEDKSSIPDKNNVPPEKRRLLTSKDDNTAILTQEGAAACLEAIQFLKSAINGPKRPPLTISPELSRSCADLVNDAGPKGNLSNVMSNGTPSSARLTKYGRWRGKLSECLAFGPTTAREVVIQWLIDDGNAKRTQRSNIFDPDLVVAGIAHGRHAKHKGMTSVAFTRAFEAGATTGNTTTIVDETASAAPSSKSKTSEANGKSTSNTTAPSANASAKAIGSSEENPSTKSELQETEDGRFYEIRSAPTNATRDAVKVTKTDRAIDVEVTTEERVSTQKFLVPFDCSASQGDVLAAFDDKTTEVVLRMKKPGLDSDVIPGDVDVLGGTVNIPKLESSGSDKVQVIPKQVNLGFEFLLKGSNKFDSTLKILLKDGKKVILELEHVEKASDHDGNIRHTRTEAFGMPFVVPIDNVVPARSKDGLIVIEVNPPVPKLDPPDEAVAVSWSPLK